jgi:hypothetical protein
MEFLTKYSKKCVNFVKNDSIPKPIINVIDIQKKMNEAYKFINYKITKELFIPKLHDITDLPLFYRFMKSLSDKKELGKHKIPTDDKYFADIIIFFKWCRTFQILDEFDNFYKLVEKSKEYIEFIKTLTKEQKKVINFIDGNKFMSLDVQQHMESSDIQYFEVMIDNCLVILYVPKSLSIHIDTFLQKIAHILEFYKLFCKFKIRIEIFLGKQRKEFSFDDLLSSDNVNTGMTDRIKIKIWRCEEILKVLFHEMIHYLNLIPHSNEKNYDLLCDFYKNTFNYDGVDAHYEALTEALAIIYHSVFIEFYTKIPFDEVIYHELCFTLFQISKILDFYHMKPSDLFDKNKNSIFQTTNVLSYYIVKGFIIFNAGWFGCDILEYITFLKKAIASNFLMYVNMDKLGEKNDNFIWKTLRMSCYELTY